MNTIHWNKDNSENGRVSINDGVETVYVSEDQLPDQFCLSDIAEAYAASYDHNGLDGYSIARIVDLHDGEKHTFAFAQDGSFDWDTHREFVS